MAIVDDDSPIYQGDTGAPFNPVFQTLDASGKLVPYDLTGCTISMTLQGVFEPEDGVLIACSGVWTIVNATAGMASYAYSTNDVATPGTWQRYITITKAGKPIHADMKIFTILPVPS
jgi:hypothetical protein